MQALPVPSLLNDYLPLVIFVGVSAFIGMLGLCFAFHGLLAQTFLGAALRMDIDTVREAQAPPGFADEPHDLLGHR